MIVNSLELSARTTSPRDQLHELRERMKPLTLEIDLQDEIVEAVDRQLYGVFAPRWEKEKEAKERRARAMEARFKAIQALQPLRAKEGELTLRLAEANRELERLAFTETKLSDLEQAADELVTQIAATDTRLVDLASEQAALREKMLGVNQLITLEDDAQEEVDKAQEALDKAEGDAFISGVEIDLSARKARIAKAAKRLSDAAQMARGSKSVRPRLAEAMKAICDETAALEKARHSLLADWWGNAKRQEVVRFTATANTLVTTAQTMAALDQRTSDSLGSAVLNHLRAGVRVPVKGGTEAIVIPHYDTEQCLAKLTEALNAAISTATKKIGK